MCCCLSEPAHDVSAYANEIGIDIVVVVVVEALVVVVEALVLSYCTTRATRATREEADSNSFAMLPMSLTIG